MHETLFEFQGDVYPTYLRDGNAMQFFVPFAQHFCKGRGVDVGCGKWPFPGAIGVDQLDKSCEYGAMNLPEGEFDYCVSSHCLEHLSNPVMAIEHWKSRLRVGGTLALYLPHPSQKYWRPQNCRKHVHMFYPADVAQMLRDLGFDDVLHSERDLAWSFCVVGFKS